MKPHPVSFFLAGAEDLAKIHQVAFVPIVATQEAQPNADELTQALFQAIQGRRMFQVDVVSADEPACKDIDFSSHQPMTLPQMAALRQALHCDAVLYGSISDFQAYPRMRVSLRLCLVDLRRGKLLWGIDESWDTVDKSLSGRIEDYYSRQMTEAASPMGPRLVQVSSQAFGKFVAFEIAQTLPDNSKALPTQHDKMEDVKKAVKQATQDF